MSGLADKNCVPCEGGMSPLTEAQIVPLLAQLEGWEMDGGDDEDESCDGEDGGGDDGGGHHLYKSYAFPDFAGGLEFVNRIGAIADEQGHHPDVALSWGEVQVLLFTHEIDGLTESDFILAAKFDGEYHPEPIARRQIWRASDPAHAHLLAGLLGSRGIDAQVRGENLFAGEGGLLPTEAGPTVWVPVTDAERAHEILTTHHDGAGADDEAGAGAEGAE